MRRETEDKDHSAPERDEVQDNKLDNVLDGLKKKDGTWHVSSNLEQDNEILKMKENANLRIGVHEILDKWIDCDGKDLFDNLNTRRYITFAL